MGEMRDSDWSRRNLLRSDWSGPSVAIYTTNQDLERLLKLNANFIANAGDIQEATILDFFPWGRYLPVKSYDRIFKVFDEIHSIIRKFVRERKDTFDPTE